MWKLGTEAAHILFWEYINGIFLAVQAKNLNIKHLYWNEFLPEGLYASVVLRCK